MDGVSCSSRSLADYRKYGQPPHQQRLFRDKFLPSPHKHDLNSGKSLSIQRIKKPREVRKPVYAAEFVPLIDGEQGDN